MSKYKFSMNHAINWNAVKENFFDFSTTTSVEPCMAAALLAASGLRFIHELIQFGEDVLNSCTNSFTQHK